MRDGVSSMVDAGKRDDSIIPGQKDFVDRSTSDNHAEGVGPQVIPEGFSANIIWEALDSDNPRFSFIVETGWCGTPAFALTSTFQLGRTLFTKNNRSA